VIHRWRRTLVLGSIVVVTVGAAACGSSSKGGSGDSSSSKIVIGISAAKTGIFEAYDLQAGELLEQRLDEINAAGGVLGGKKFKVKWIDTNSDKPTAGTNAQQLINSGAKLIVATCDFDFAYPALAAARQANIPGISLCGSSPRTADSSLVGPYGGSMGLGSDTEGVAMAEWLHEHEPTLKSAYIMTDTLLAYTQATAEYFAAEWKRLGGTICGDDSFVSSNTLDLAAQITRLRSAASGCDVIYDSSIIPAGAQLVRGIRAAGIDLPIVTNAGVNGTSVDQIGGNPDNFYALGYGCVDTYCSGGSAAVAKVNADFKARYGEGIQNSYALPGYDLGSAIAAAITEAGSTDPADIGKALFDSDLTFTELSGQSVTITSACHRPSPAAYTVEKFVKGKASQVGEVVVKNIPDVGDGNPCLSAAQS
jgi:branched-chain amino acid transport system substrate-binding protein